MNRLHSFLSSKDNITKEQCLRKQSLYRTYTIKEKVGKKEFLYVIDEEGFKTVVKETKHRGISKALYTIARHEMLNRQTRNQKSLKDMNRNELYVLLKRNGIQAISNMRKENEILQ